MANANRIKLSADFYLKDVLDLAPGLLGKVLVIRNKEGNLERHVINETEAYRGDGDLACHASKGRTKRTDIMFHRGGLVYVYLIYGLYWMLNIVSEREGVPQAVLIRGVDGILGPGRLGRALELNKSYYGEDLCTSDRIWIEDAEPVPFKTSARIGIDYSGEPWVSKPWRFLTDKKL